MDIRPAIPSPSPTPSLAGTRRRIVVDLDGIEQLVEYRRIIPEGVRDEPRRRVPLSRKHEPDVLRRVHGVEDHCVRHPAMTGGSTPSPRPSALSSTVRPTGSPSPPGWGATTSPTSSRQSFPTKPARASPRPFYKAGPAPMHPRRTCPRRTGSTFSVRRGSLVTASVPTDRKLQWSSCEAGQPRIVCSGLRPPRWP